MKVFSGIMTFITTVALAVTFIGAGFAACLAPPVTHVLASMFSDDATSPFSRAQLVQVADATREYSFGNHDELALYRQIYEVNVAYQQSVVNTGGKVGTDFPKVDTVTASSNLTQMKKAYSDASELYCFSEDTIAHLNDCYRIVSFAFPILIVLAAVALVGLVFTGVVCRRRRVGGVLMAAGIVVIVALVALGVFAVVDFSRFFTLFHGVFFSQGNWQFPYDSLLICSLPTPFWMGMGALWLIVALLVSTLSIVVGHKVRK